MKITAKEKTVLKFLSFHEGTIRIEDIKEMFDICDKLHRYETTLNRIYTTRLNDRLSPEREVQLRKQELTAITNVTEIAKKLGFEFYISDEPRGKAIRFRLPDGRSYNCADGETWVIDW